MAKTVCAVMDLNDFLAQMGEKRGGAAKERISTKALVHLLASKYGWNIEVIMG